VIGTSVIGSLSAVTVTAKRTGSPGA